MVNEYILLPFDLAYMQTVAFILIIASLVQFVEMFLMKSMPSLYQALGIYLPLITTNCAVLGVALLNVQQDLNFIGSIVYGCFGGVGFTLAIVLFASVRERLELAEFPEGLRRLPHRFGQRLAAGHGVHGLPGPENLLMCATHNERMR